MKKSQPRTPAEWARQVMGKRRTELLPIVYEDIVQYGAQNRPQMLLEPVVQGYQADTSQPSS